MLLGHVTFQVNVAGIHPHELVGEPSEKLILLTVLCSKLVIYRELQEIG